MKKHPKGHPGTYIALAVAAGLFWFVPIGVFEESILDAQAKLGLLRSLTSDLTITVKGMGTLLAAVIALLYYKTR